MCEYVQQAVQVGRVVASRRADKMAIRPWDCASFDWGRLATRGPCDRIHGDGTATAPAFYSKSLALDFSGSFSFLPPSQNQSQSALVSTICVCVCVC